MQKHYLYAFCLFICILGIPSNNIPKPKHSKILSNAPKQLTIQKHQTLSINFPMYGYIVGLTVKERVNNPKLNLSSAYQERNQQFKQSQSCEIIDPQISMNKKVEISVDSSIREYYVDKQTKLLFIITQIDFRIYQPTSSNITLSKVFPMIDGFKDTKLTIIKLHGKIYCTNSTSFYQFQNYRHPTQASLVFWTNVPKNQALKGLNITDTHLDEIKIINIGQQDLLFLYYHFFIIYQYDPLNQLLKFVPKKYTLDQIKMKQGFFVDVIHDDFNLYLLNIIMGVVELVHFHPNDPATLIVNHYPIQYDELIKMKKFGSVFEIICKYRKKKFVAEMMLETKVGKTKQMILNRFYDKVDGVNDVEMFNQHLHVYGENEIHLYGPAINRYTLFTQKQYPYIFTNYGIQSFAFLSQQQKIHQTMQILGINKDSISYLQVKTEQPSLKCKPLQDIQLRLSIISSCCKDGVCDENILKMCEYIQDKEINIINKLNHMEALTIIGGVIVIIIIIGIVILGLYIKGFKILNNEIQQVETKIAGIINQIIINNHKHQGTDQHLRNAQGQAIRQQVENNQQVEQNRD